jgi:exodeoxyribonuclease V gamma subunit
VSLGKDADPIEHREPLLLGSLESWSVGDRILRHVASGGDPGSTFAALRADGALPLGTPGRHAYDELLPEVEAIARRAQTLTRGGPLAPLEIDAVIGGVRLTGVVDELFAGRGHLRVQFSRLQRRSELVAWIHHLVLSCCAPDGVPRAATLIGRVAPGDKTGAIQVGFRPVTDARSHLERLIELYLAGTRQPLPLFTGGASRAYAAALATPNGDAARGLDDAHRSYDDENLGYGDGFDPYTRVAFAGTEPLDPTLQAAPLSFASLAVEVFGPLLAHREALS